MSLTDEQVKNLEKKAHDIRVSIIEMLIEAKSGHTAGPLDMADIFTYLYFGGNGSSGSSGSVGAMKYDAKKPEWPDRDRLVLSNGHICPVLYASMAHAGYFPMERLKTLRKLGSPLQGHPHREWLPSLETSSGPLGCGLSQAVGMAIADRIDQGRTSPRRIFALLSDGELDEGNSWEAALLAGKEKLTNLLAIVDRNCIQIDGFTEDIMPLEPLADKWRSFGWHVLECDGHNFGDIDHAVGESRAISDKPTVILARTIPSKGIPEFERQFEWHGKPPTTPDEIAIARRALHN
jgi:transketolase